MMGLSHQVREYLPILLLTRIICYLTIHVCVATSRDTITSSYILKHPETLSSNDGNFHLGFFTPSTNSTFYYLGIWYMSNPPAVWVANRDQPLNDSSSGELKLSEDGNLILINSQKKILWSTMVSNVTSNTTTAQLLNTGNLVLQENTAGRTLWESFQHPTDTFLQNMKLSTNKNSGTFTSWKSSQDPSIGDYSLSLERLNIPQVFIWRGNSQPHWRSGPWNGQIFLGVPNMTSSYLDGFYFGGEDGASGTYFLAYKYMNMLVSYVLSADGNIQGSRWDYAKRHWSVIWSAINSECDAYGKCGAFGICNPTSSPICSCLRGYEPTNAEEWNRQNWTSGCVRKKPLQYCNGVTNGSEAGNNDDGFVKLQSTKVPDFAQLSSSPPDDDCRTQCFGNCSCIAYAHDAGTGCMFWSANLIDTQTFSSGGTDLYIRVPRSELDEEKKSAKAIIIATVIVGTIVIVTLAYIFWKRITRDGENVRIWTNRQKNDESKAKLQELCQFKFGRLTTATNNFCLDNKLGQGGFGSVYKGTLEDGQEIAVKRLSRASRQGLEEFMNEIVVISKLQHRNLVKLLGCCIEGDEKILIYEYMPNKSLDAYMFGPSKYLLNWEKRFSILEGIARGLLYLHRDSRLRIIHRDLKLGNILLDEELNPKISDFGMAKIFSHTEDEANTKKVVGTFGYMSPEYAMEGLFSEKYDVFSFGVLLLEIASMRKNIRFYEDAEGLSLIGFAWKLWNVDKITYLIDPEISNSSYNADIIRCIHIGLLCVQELARDRPTMTTVISMLSSQTVNLPPPKQPAFIQRQTMLDIDSSLRSDAICSTNYVSLTNIQGR